MKPLKINLNLHLHEDIIKFYLFINRYIFPFCLSLSLSLSFSTLYFQHFIYAFLLKHISQIKTLSIFPIFKYIILFRLKRNRFIFFKFLTIIVIRCIQNRNEINRESVIVSDHSSSGPVN